MSASFRIIAKIDIKNTSVIKGINFEGMRKVGDAKKFALNYFQKRIDELVINDVNASLFSRNTHTNFLKSSCEKIFIPVTLQGGFRTIDNIRDALEAGLTSIRCTGAVYDKKLVANASKIFGNQAIVVSVDSKEAKNKWEVFVDKGRERTGLNVVEWIKFIQKSGTGEIHLNSIDKDGEKVLILV